jgi:hypothetical protein
MNPQAQAVVPYLAGPIATLIIVVLGMFFSNRHLDARISDLSRSIDARFAAADARIRFEPKHRRPIRRG